MLACSTPVFSQGVRSPFSTYGIGEPYGNALIQNQGMGGIGVSQPQFWYLNNQNPALLVYNTVTVFQAGMVGDSRTIKGDSLSEKNFGGNLNYLATAFPIKPTKWTLSLGLMPYTTVDYAVQFYDFARDNNGVVQDTLLARETGSGGLTQFYLSNGVRLTKELAIGLKAAYIFGPIETVYANRTTNPEQTRPFLVNITEKTRVNDFLLTTGISFSKDSLGARNNYRFNAGATYSLNTKFKASKRTEISRTTVDGSVIESDTLNLRGGSLNIPGALTVGFSLSRGSRWTVATEFSYQDWSKFESISADDEGLDQSYRAALGGEFTPDAFAGENLLKRITYRAGLSYERMPYVVNGNPVNDFGINFGFSVPAGRSSLDLAFKVGQRGNKSENLLMESYFKMYFGITFNDQWFIRRKFD